MFEDVKKHYRNYLQASWKTLNQSFKNKNTEENIDLAYKQLYPLYEQLRGNIEKIHQYHLDAIAQKQARQDMGQTLLSELVLE